MSDQAAKAEVLLTLHREPRLLLLADTCSKRARIFEEAGLAVIAATSAGIRSFPRDMTPSP